MVRRRERGFTLMEVVVVFALFAVFIAIFCQLTLEMWKHEKNLPVSWLAHPQTGALLARLRRDVEDSTNPYYPSSYQTYEQSSQLLLVYSLQPSGYAQTIVWDFTKTGLATRRAFSVGAMTSEWTARGVPRFQVDDWPIDDHPDSVRITARDDKGHVVIDQIFQPRSH